MTDAATDPLSRRQLAVIRRLVLGGDAPVAIDPTRGERYQRWQADDYDAWTTGSDGVFFRTGTDQLVNYTIQSSLELDEDELRPRPWTHDCTGEDCGMCPLL